MSKILDWISDYIVVVAVVILLIIITFLLLIFMPRPKCYFDAEDICKELILLSKEQYFKVIKDEILKVTDNVDIEGKVKMLDIYRNNQLHETAAEIPETYDLLRSIPNVRRASIVIIDKKTDVEKHKGSNSYQFTNNTIRCILPIKIPGAKKSGIWVDGETKMFAEEQWVIYDNSREHSIYNKHKRLQLTALLIDLDRPHHIPTGIASEDVNFDI